MTSLPAEQIFIPFSIDEDSNKIGLLIDYAPAHVYLSGQTGSGKSTFLHTVALNLLNQYSKLDAVIWLFDGKGNEFNDYSETVITQIKKAFRGWSSDNIKALLDSLDLELQSRKKAFVEAEAYNYQTYRVSKEGQSNPLPRIFVLIEDYDMIELFVRDNPEYRYELTRFLAESWALGITLIACSQSTLWSMCSTLDRFFTRLAFRGDADSVSQTLDAKICDSDMQWLTAKRGNLLCKNVFLQTASEYQPISCCKCSIDYLSTNSRKEQIKQLVSTQ